MLEAERTENILVEQPTPQEAFRPSVRAADCEEEEEVRLARPSPRERRPKGREGRCYRRDEPGHQARDCPAPAPKPRAPQPAGTLGLDLLTRVPVSTCQGPPSASPARQAQDDGPKSPPPSSYSPATRQQSLLLQTGKSCSLPIHALFLWHHLVWFCGVYFTVGKLWYQTPLFAACGLVGTFTVTCMVVESVAKVH
ncbi:translation initiation factor IF-2-like isoform X1 [Anguilla anguilla]|uniref:translation initiation factor IF-2-like isoform X1 n=1 Tax=Anguilla anguilla TaxID=7936 RepID=UPI0015A91B50|nr:translation initiation factor IF-2-like isoform X1 [Anguilla anguilla]